jgi:hypothetical protein
MQEFILLKISNHSIKTYSQHLNPYKGNAYIVADIRKNILCILGNISGRILLFNFKTKTYISNIKYNDF